MERGVVRSTAERRGIRWRARTGPVLAKLPPLYHIITNCQVVYVKSLAFREIEERRNEKAGQAMACGGWPMIDASRVRCMRRHEKNGGSTLQLRLETSCETETGVEFAAALVGDG